MMRLPRRNPRRGLPAGDGPAQRQQIRRHRAQDEEGIVVDPQEG
jgi:hypothetical protein